ncbi:GGDEF domain-containing protein [Actinoplanes derwentensis]|uniref:Diguanylate cyclase (GGDEF) domain-containing protein n=1 Tax=Actinoplanes derwentensis TaxID=113562 RepID=A0A1H2AN14_9ACTN|nr:GGDEF domain-containing protein [Actinoplanes derwentensis]GID89279.1 hypothetical protein Ade03nite_82030 [Actinoplanes derwentensis]SDT47368.1 diguanylate cyclase (GGDEF) domain-containing protein [Actinoplanes derwentensis]
MSRLGAFTLLLGIGLAATLISVHAEAEMVGTQTQVALTLFALDVTAMAAAVVAWRHPAARRGWGIMAVAFALLATSGLLRQVFPAEDYPFPSPADVALLAFVPVAVFGLSRLTWRSWLLTAAALATVGGEVYLSVRQSPGGDLVDSCLLVAHFLLALAPLAQLRDAAADRFDIPEPGTDPLTGLFDRRGLHTGLSVALARNARGPKTVAVVLTDLDGSEYGDELRRAYGRMLRANVLGTDLVARISGDMFAIVLQDINDPAQADAVVTRIRDAMREPVLIGDLMVQPRAGFGVAVAEPGETDADTLLHRAGLALSENRVSDRTPPAPR